MKFLPTLIEAAADCLSQRLVSGLGGKRGSIIRHINSRTYCVNAIWRLSLLHNGQLVEQFVRRYETLFKGAVFAVCKLYVVFAAFLVWAERASADTADTVCATVVMQVDQQLTQERQAFDASMTIKNAFPNSALTEISVDVNFTDAEGNSVVATSDPDNTSAKFYLRLAGGSSIPH